jgi:hypothetical protein
MIDLMRLSRGCECHQHSQTEYDRERQTLHKVVRYCVHSRLLFLTVHAQNKPRCMNPGLIQAVVFINFMNVS